MHVALWLLPLSIVGIKALLKLYIDHQATLPEGITIALGLPFDIAFVAASLLAGQIIIDQGDKQYHVGLFVLNMMLGIVAMILFRYTERLFARRRWVGLALLGTLNFALTVSMIVYVVSLINRVGTKS